jgi:hypothetical protein
MFVKKPELYVEEAGKEDLGRRDLCKGSEAEGVAERRSKRRTSYQGSEGEQENWEV